MEEAAIWEKVLWLLFAVFVVTGGGECSFDCIVLSTGRALARILEVVLAFFGAFSCYALGLLTYTLFSRSLRFFLLTGYLLVSAGKVAPALAFISNLGMKNCLVFTWEST